jgi:translation initiation factor IF-2
MSGSEKKLFKVAAEINIGKENIVQYLQTKGYQVENKPTFVLSEEMLDAVYEKFKREKKATDKQREKIEKHKLIRKPAADSRSKVSAEVEEGRPHAAEAAVGTETETFETLDFDFQIFDDFDTDKPADIPVETIEVPKETNEKTDIPDILPLEEIKAKAPEKIHLPISKDGPKKIGGETSEPASIDTKSSKDKQPRDGTELPAKIELGSIEIVAETKTEKEKKEVIQPKAKEKEIVAEPKTSEIKPESKPDEPEYKVGEVIPQKDMSAAALTEEESRRETKGRRRRKRKKVAEVELEPGQMPKLKGLTIVGKIDLKPEIKPLKSKRDLDEEDLLSLKSKPLKLKKKLKIKGKDKVTVIKEKLAEKKKKRKRSVREMISEDDVNRAIKETLAGIDDTANAAQRTKLKLKKRHEREEREQKKIEEEERLSQILQLSEFVTTSDLASLLHVSPNDIILKCMDLGLMVGINQRLDKDTLTLIADDYGMQVEFLDEKAVQFIETDEIIDDQLLPRSPIVTIMGHVDHGKTSLLDYIRSANVVAGEAGGITQHIGAYRVDLPNDKHITFLDTPGHEAFTAMRARGAQATDIVILVVAADDSVMPQTIEAISHAKAANVPIVVAINKIDKPDANPEKIKQQLADKGVLIEEWGGKHQCVEISAKKGTNVDILLEKILIEAEILDLRANPDRKARGTVIESNMDKGLGPVSTIIVQKGTLRVGDPFIAGAFSGKVRAMFDERNNKMEAAFPSMPARVIGFDGLPQAGDIIAGVTNDYEARAISNQRMQLRREQEFRQVHLVTLDEISKQIQLGGVKDLFLIIKGDVGGSVEALSDSLQKLSRDEVRVVILHKGVGSITESDVMLAVASKAVIIGFQVYPTGKARKIAEAESVDIRIYNIIYDCINEVKLALEGLLTPEIKEEITAQVEVRRVFKISKMGAVAGCYVLSGKLSRGDKVRLIRDGLIVYRGGLQSLKRGKDDVREIETGYECGIVLDNFHDFHENDIIEGFKVTEIKRTFS